MLLVYHRVQEEGGMERGRMYNIIQQPRLREEKQNRVSNSIHDEYEYKINHEYKISTRRSIMYLYCVLLMQVGHQSEVVASPNSRGRQEEENIMIAS